MQNQTKKGPSNLASQQRRLPQAGAPDLPSPRAPKTPKGQASPTLVFHQLFCGSPACNSESKWLNNRKQPWRRTHNRSRSIVGLSASQPWGLGTASSSLTGRFRVATPLTHLSLPALRSSRFPGGWPEMLTRGCTTLCWSLSR